MDSSILQSLKISPGILDELNRFLLDPENPMIASFLSVIEKYGGVGEINRKAKENGKPENLVRRLVELNSPYVRDLQWLREQKDNRAFMSVEEYRKKVLGESYYDMTFKDDFAVTLELSAAQYFP